LDCSWPDFSYQCGYGIAQTLLSSLYVRRSGAGYWRYQWIFQVCSLILCIRTCVFVQVHSHVHLHSYISSYACGAFTLWLDIFFIFFIKIKNLYLPCLFCQCNLLERQRMASSEVSFHFWLPIWNLILYPVVSVCIKILFSGYKHSILFADLFCAPFVLVLLTMWQAAPWNFWEIATVGQTDGET
jgi:hypothetical protein